MSAPISDFTALVLSKSNEAPELMKKGGRASAMYWAALELWNAEYASWKALSSLFGVDYPAAACAWERRTAYSEIASILLHAW